MKRTATFGRFIRWVLPVGLGPIRARLGDVRDHPRHGDQDSMDTSAIVRIKYEMGIRPVEIETRNTLYKRQVADE